MTSIIVRNTQCKLDATAKVILKVRKHPYFAIKAKGAFYSPAWQSKRWDGMIRFVNEQGYFKAGKLNHMLEVLKELGESFEIIDERDDIPNRFKITRHFPGGIDIRKYQFEGLKAIKTNRVGGILFPRCVIGMATNAGKTLMAAGIHLMYEGKTAFFIKSKELLNQALEELPKLIPGKVGWIASGKGEQWNDFMIIMVPTVRSKMAILGPKLAKFKKAIIDECDEGTSDSFQKVLACTYNAPVRVGMSGSVFTDPRKKEKNEKVRAEFGEVVYEIKNKQMIEEGHSSDVIIYIHNGNTLVKSPGDFNYEHKYGIIKSAERNSKIVELTTKRVRQNKLPMLIICKHHKHLDYLLKRLKKKSDIIGHELFGLRIEKVHHETPNRSDIVTRFKQGKIDILVGSYILKRGMNFPLMKWVINAGGGDSMENILQILGRATRKHESKKFTGMDDFYDKGKYLRRHSYHRLSTYKKEGLKVIEKYSKKLL